jgi:uroporphyrinogen decarboxylase
MNHRERVLAAVNHQEPDYVPLVVGGGAHTLTDPVYFDLLKYFNLGEPVAPFRRNMGHTSNYYDDRVMEALDMDVRHVWLGFTDLAGPTPDGGDDAWGIRYKRAGIYTQAVTYPLENATLDDLEAYPFPQPDQLVRRDELRERARYLKEHTDYAVVGRAFDSFGPFERASGLRRVDQLLMDLAMNPDFVERLVGKITDVLCRLAEIYVETAGEYLDILELPGDDYAAQRLIISPKMFDRFFAPAFRRIIGVIKQGAPHVKVLYHSDGNMEPLLGRLADLGVDIFHCLEPMPGVDMAAVKQKHGERLCFWGAIDIKEAMQGDAARVEAEVKERIRLLGQGGGYVLAPANHLQPDVPAANVAVLFSAGRKYGRYPLQLE